MQKKEEKISAKTRKIAREQKIHFQDKLQKKVNELQVQVLNWQSNELRTSNDRLYELLAGCLEISEFVNENQARMFAFSAVWSKSELKLAGKSSMIGKVVRLVFRERPHRWSAYSRVLEAAIGEHIKHADFVAWIKEKGGIEEVRLDGAKGLTSAEFRDLGQNALAQNSKELAKVKVIHEDVQRGNTVLLLGHVDNDGNVLIQSALSSTSLENQFLVQLGRKAHQSGKKSGAPSSPALTTEDMLKDAYEDASA